MFHNDHYSSKASRGSGALEISMHARKVARDQESLLAGLRSQAARRKSTRWSFTQLLTSLKLF